MTSQLLLSPGRPRGRFAVVLSILAALGTGAVLPARAQDTGSDSEAIAAFKKAALVIEGHGDAPVTADGFYVKVELHAEGKGRLAVASDCRKSYDLALKALEGKEVRFVGSREPFFQVLRRTGPSTYHGVVGPMTYSALLATPENGNMPDDVFKVTSILAFGVDTPAKVREIFAAMRATGAQGTVTVSSSGDDKAGHTLALKAALADAQHRVKILGEAAKPKVLDLVYIKEGEYQMQSQESLAELQGHFPLQVQDTISASASVTLFYGFKSESAPAKVVKTAKSTAAGKQP